MLTRKLEHEGIKYLLISKYSPENEDILTSLLRMSTDHLKAIQESTNCSLTAFYNLPNHFPNFSRVILFDESLSEPKVDIDKILFEGDMYKSKNILENSIMARVQNTFCRACKSRYACLILEPGDFYPGNFQLLESRKEKFKRLSCPHCGEVFWIYVIKILFTLPGTVPNSLLLKPTRE